MTEFVKKKTGTKFVNFEDFWRQQTHIKLDLKVGITHHLQGSTTKSKLSETMIQSIPSLFVNFWAEQFWNLIIKCACSPGPGNCTSERHVFSKLETLSRGFRRENLLPLDELHAAEQLLKNQPNSTFSFEKIVIKVGKMKGNQMLFFWFGVE